MEERKCPPRKILHWLLLRKEDKCNQFLNEKSIYRPDTVQEKGLREDNWESIKYYNLRTHV